MAAIGLYINSTEQGFTVRGVNNNFFPDNATLAYPANSVILITDESDMATFRSASNYDVLFSALIKDININGEQVTKDNIIETFNEAANQSSGGGGNPDAFTSVEYDGRKSLIFYNDKGDEVANVDVTPFIKDGMVSNVEILNGNLIITFNTDSGKQPITIPLTDIFNPANYYDKTTADSTFATQVVVNEEIAARIQGDADINTALQAKADKSEIPDTSEFITKEEYNPKELATAKALTQLNETKADKTELPDVSTLATKTELNAKANSADLATVATSGSYNDLSDKPVIPEGAVVDAALSDTSENPVQNKVVKGALDAKQNVLQYYSEHEYDEETGEGGNAEIQVEGESPILIMSTSAADGTVDSIELDSRIFLTDIKNDGSGNKSEANIRIDTGEIYFAATKEENGETNRTLMLVNPTGVTINNEKVLTESDGVYYVDFAAMSVQGITDADWDGLVGAINAHRPILVKANVSNGYVNAITAYIFDNNIIVVGADEGNASQYTFTKNGSNDYSVSISTKQFVSQGEKDAWNAKQDALQYYSEIKYDEETGEEATAMIQVIGQGESSGINVQPYVVELGTASEGEETTLIIQSDGVTINDERVLTEPDLESAKAYYVDFAAFSTQGITDADWDGMVATINAHRPIYAGLGNRYYTAECLYQDGSNIIRMTASDELNHYFYMFTKRGTNDYTMTYEVRPYVTEVEKHTWSAKQDALISGTNIKTINNQSIIGAGNIEIQGGGMDEDTELLISSALVDLNDRKIDATEVKENYQKKGDYATNTKVDTKANISDVPTNEDYEEAQKITSWSLNELNKRIVELEARVAQLEA